MTRFVDKGFVLRTVRYGERQILLDLFLKEHGRMLVGSQMQKKGPFQVLNQQFVFAEFEIEERRGRFRLKGGSVTHDFRGLREDIRRLSAANQLARMALDGLQEGVIDHDVYALLAHGFYQLSIADRPELILSLTALRLVSEFGFAPWVLDCVRCHEPLSDHALFAFEEAGTVCNKGACQQGLLRVRPQRMTARERELIEAITEGPMDAIYRLPMTAKEADHLVDFTTRYLQEVMEKDYYKESLLGELDDFAARAIAKLKKERGQ